MFNKPPVNHSALHRPLQVLVCRMGQIVGTVLSMNPFDLGYSGERVT